jgi:flagellar biosynthesis GTPase FlhF
MNTSIENIKALEDLAKELGLEVTITTSNTNTEVTRKPSHSNAGKNYQTKNLILKELRDTSHQIQESVSAHKDALALAKEKRREVQELDRKIAELKITLGKLLTEAQKKKVTIRELKKAKVVIPSGRPRKEAHEPTGFQHDFGADEWSYECSTCKVTLYAPTLYEMQEALPRHTKSKDCLGGY